MTNFQFPSNEYTDQYFQFLESSVSPEENYERHHIYPKAIFGDNDVLIKLSYKDHFKAHWYLFKIYEAAQMKRQYMQMAKAFFSFVNVNYRRKDLLTSYTIFDLEDIGDLVQMAKEENRKSSIGENNGFYGKNHSPETLQMISENRKPRKWSEEQIENYKKFIDERNPDDVKRWFYHNPETFIQTRISTNDEMSGNIPTGFIKGKYHSKMELLLRSLRAQEVASTKDYSNIPKGEDSPSFGTKRAYDPITLIQITLKPGDELPDGYIFGQIFPEEWYEDRKRAGLAMRGVPKPYMQVTNRDPEKIRKTAEWHTGKTRNKEACSNIKEGIRKFYDNGGESATKGKIRLFNTITRKFSYFYEHEKCNAISKGEFTDVMTRIVKNSEGHKLTITDLEELPNGYKYAPNSGK